MKDLDKDIEKKLKDQFNQQDFDIQDAWLDDMSSQLDDYNKKDRKVFFFWLFGCALLLSTMAAFVWKSNFLVHKEESTLVSKDINNVKQKEKKKNSLYSETYEFKYTELPCEPHELIESSESHKESNLSNLVSNSVSTSNDKLTTISKPTKTLNKNTQITKTNDFSNLLSAKNLVKENNKNNKPVESIPTKNEEKNVTNNHEISFLKGVQLEENNKNTSDIKKQETDENLLLKEVEIESKENIDLVELSSSEKQGSIEIIEEKTDIDSIQELLNEEPKKEEITQPKKDLGLKLSLNAGASFLFRSFNSDSQNSKRHDEESNKVAWNLNLELHKVFANNLILGTGVNITNYGEKINYSSILETYKDTSYQSEVYNYFNVKVSNMNQVLTFDTTSVLYYDTTTIIIDSIYENTAIQKDNGTTNFTYIEIPVLVGYQFLDTKKWKLTALTGFSAGFLINANGSYLNKENQLEPAVNEKVIFNYLLSAQLDYNIYKNLNLSLVPHFKYNLNNVSTYTATKKIYANFGVNAGLSFDF